MSKKSDFIRLAQPTQEGISRWVSVDEFVGDYSDLVFANGFSWGRRSSGLAKQFVIETKKEKGQVRYIRLAGFNTSTAHHNHSIRRDITREIAGSPCVILGIGTSSDVPTEVDHKDGRKTDIRVMNIDTQTPNDFQPLSKVANDAKRQHCKNCLKSGQRFDAKQLGYSSELFFFHYRQNRGFVSRGYR